MSQGQIGYVSIIRPTKTKLRLGPTVTMFSVPLSNCFYTESHWVWFLGSEFVIIAPFSQHVHVQDKTFAPLLCIVIMYKSYTGGIGGEGCCSTFEPLLEVETEPNWRLCKKGGVMQWQDGKRVWCFDNMLYVYPKLEEGSEQRLAVNTKKNSLKMSAKWWYNAKSLTSK